MKMNEKIDWKRKLTICRRVCKEKARRKFRICILS